MKEEWKECTDYPGYFVSNKGRIKGKKVDFLKPVKGQGYLFF